MNTYVYIDRGDVAVGTYAEPVILFQCEAMTILEADKLCRQAGYEPTKWHVFTQIKKQREREVELYG